MRRVGALRTGEFLIRASWTVEAWRTTISIMLFFYGRELLLAFFKTDVTCFTRLTFQISAELVSVGAFVALNAAELFVNVVRIVARYLARRTTNGLLHARLAVRPMWTLYWYFSLLRAVECLRTCFTFAISLGAILARRTMIHINTLLWTDGARSAQRRHYLTLHAVGPRRTVFT